MRVGRCQAKRRRSADEAGLFCLSYIQKYERLMDEESEIPTPC
ncbi:hypothetical protein [Peribacillus acanthi]|nr:hypothetical protein [Peribacillus acanthi]